MAIETLIPFTGFYQTYHDASVDEVIERDSGLNWEDVNYRKVYIGYAKLYTKYFSDYVGIPLVFKELTSPKEYNFTTDKIYCEIELEQVEYMFNTVPREVLADLIKEKCTSCAGFVSFYPNDLDEWPDKLKDWDHNHIGILLDAYTHDQYDFDYDKEQELMEPVQCNGELDNLIYNNITEE